MTPAEHAARIREALTHVPGIMVGTEAEPAWDDLGLKDALASLAVLEAQAAERVAARQALQAGRDFLDALDRARSVYTSGDAGSEEWRHPEENAFRAALAGVVVPAHSEETP